MLPFININKKCQHVLEKDILFGTGATCVILVRAVKDIILMKISIINVAHVGNIVKRMA